MTEKVLIERTIIVKIGHVKNKVSVQVLGQDGGSSFLNEFLQQDYQHPIPVAWVVVKKRIPQLHEVLFAGVEIKKVVNLAI